MIRIAIASPKCSGFSLRHHEPEISTQRVKNFVVASQPARTTSLHCNYSSVCYAVLGQVNYDDDEVGPRTPHPFKNHLNPFIAFSVVLTYADRQTGKQM